MWWNLYVVLFLAPVPGNERPDDRRRAVPDRRVLLQVGRACALRARHLARVRSPRRDRALPGHTTPPLPCTTISMKTAPLNY